MQQKQLSSHTKGVSNLIDMISVESIKLRDMILSYDSSIDDSTTISLLTVINGTLIKDILKKDIGAFCCYSLVIRNCTCNIKKKCTGALHHVP